TSPELVQIGTPLHRLDLGLNTDRLHAFLNQLVHQAIAELSFQLGGEDVHFQNFAITFAIATVPHDPAGFVEDLTSSFRIIRIDFQVFVISWPTLGCTATAYLSETEQELTDDRVAIDRSRNGLAYGQLLGGALG